MTGGISGRVTASASGAPLTGVCIRAVPKTAGRTVSFTVGANGRYSLTGLTPGRYTVMFSSGCGAAGYATPVVAARDDVGGRDDHRRQGRRGELGD